MAIHESESVKYLFDHVKSVWTLSAGGTAASVALLGFIVKESRVPGRVNVLFGLGCLIAIVFYTYSIWNGLRAQVDLIQEVSDAEVAEEPASAVSKALIKTYKKGRVMFFCGCMAVILTALSFSVLNSLVEKPQATAPVAAAQINGLNVSVKPVVLTMPDSRKIEIRDLSFRLPDSVWALQESKRVEIKDLTFTIQMQDGK
jgi:hypothetical protein